MKIRSIPYLTVMFKSLAFVPAMALADTSIDYDDTELALDKYSVTATRVDRASREVPANISIIDEEYIDSQKMMNIKDAIQGTPGVLIDSKNGGYDVRLIIRGAGQKANYGVREIMVLRDGVPMTDPDSFSRFDFIDTQDIQQIEITKGPGSLFGAGSAGGTIQLISKSAFDVESNRIRIGQGNEGAENYHLRYATLLTDDQAISFTASRRTLDSNWRSWNKFDTSQFSLKHAIHLNTLDTLETELSYSKADMQLPGSMDSSQFENYKKTGKQTETASAWKHSGRYSEIWFFNSRLEKQLSDEVLFRPRLYYTHWSHYHPVTGVINDNQDNGVDSFGGDLEFVYDHQLWGDSTLVTGLTARQEQSNDARKYQYRDVSTLFTGRIISTLSDQKGDLMESQDYANTLYGFFAQESVRPNNDWLIDLGFRYDRSHFDIQTNEISQYDYRTGQYVAGAGITETDTTYGLLSQKLGISYRLTDSLNTFISVGRSDQMPSSGEITENSDIKASTSTNYELGLKGRAQQWSFDTSIYFTKVEDEIIATLENYHTTFQNAGQTNKYGFEFAGEFEITKGFHLGANYAYSRYTFDKFSEVIGITEFDRSGNQLPYVPRHQYSLFAFYTHPSGFKARIQSNSWGDYFVDNANSEKYSGYDFVTSLMLGYQHAEHALTLNIDNVFDKHYAVEVKKDTYGNMYYSAAAPQTVMLTYSYNY